MSLLKWVKKAKNFWFELFCWQKSLWRRWYTKLFSISATEQISKIIANKKKISLLKSKGLSDETIKPPATSDNSLTPLIGYLGSKTRITFTGSCFKQPDISYTHRTIVNIYIVYELSASSSHTDDPTLKNCLFGAVTLNKNVDIEKYEYSGYGIRFDRRSTFSFPGGGFGQNVIIFGVDMSSSVYVDNKNKDILILGKGPAQGLKHTLTAAKMYSINVTVTKAKFCLSLHYNGANSYLFVNGTEIYKSQKTLKLQQLHYV